MRTRPQHGSRGLFAVALAATLAWSLGFGPAAAADGRGVRDVILDVPLVDHEGENVLLYSDLLEGKTVICYSFYTSCLDICPTVMKNMQGVQRWLGDRLGRDVFMVGFSVDPEVDTPERMKAYAEKHGGLNPGWQLVTGTLTNADAALLQVGFYSRTASNHSQYLYILDEPRANWVKADGLGKKKEIIRRLKEVLATVEAANRAADR